MTQFPTVRAVLFQVDGRTVTTFGSEGIQLDGPQARSDFREQLPTIFVDRPAFGAAAGNPARVTGSADVFEATFRIAILDGARKVLTDQRAMANCGAGCEPRGTFDVRVGTTCHGRRGARCACTTARPRTAARRTSATTRSG